MYLIMEYVENGSVTKIMKTFGIDIVWGREREREREREE